MEVAGYSAMEFDPRFRARHCTATPRRRLGTDDRAQLLLGAPRLHRRRLQRDPAQHPRQDRAGALTRHGLRSFTDEQRMLQGQRASACSASAAASSSARPLARARRLQPRAVAPIRRPGPAGPALRRSRRRPRRRPGRHHDRDGGARPRARAGALPRYRRAGGGLLRAAASRAQRAALVPAIAARRADAGLRAQRSRSRATTWPMCDHARAARGRRLGARTARSASCWHGDSADQLIVSARIAGEPRDRDGHRAVPRRCRAPTACSAPRLSHAGPAARAPTSDLDEVRVGDDALLGEPGAALPVDRARGRWRHRRAVRRSGRRAWRGARADRRLPEDAQAVRRRDRLLPGAAAPRGGHAGDDRAGAQHGACTPP